MSKQEINSEEVQFVADLPDGLRILERDLQGGQTITIREPQLSPDGEDLSKTVPSTLAQHDPDTLIGTVEATGSLSPATLKELHEVMENPGGTVS